MKQIINWGIVAPGRIAHKFAHDLQLVDGARLHAVASRSIQRARDFAAQYGATYSFGKYEDMAGCPDLDVVYIASPHSGHCEHTMLFLKHQIPVLCEKPLAINSSQAREMVAAARRHDTFLMEAIWTRFIPMFEQVLNLVKDGEIGEIDLIRADFGFKAAFDPGGRLFAPSLGGGALLDVGIYPVYLATQLWGRPSITKATAVFGPTGTDDSCAMLLRFPGNKLAILDATVTHNTDTTASLYGTKGTIVIQRRFHEPESIKITYDNGEEKTLKLPKKGHGYCHEISAVNRALRKGQKECERLPLDLSLLLMENLDAIRREAGITYPED